MSFCWSSSAFRIPAAGMLMKREAPTNERARLPAAGMLLKTCCRTFDTQIIDDAPAHWSSSVIRALKALLFPRKFWRNERTMAIAVEKTKIPYHVSEGLWSAFPQFFARSNARCRRRLAASGLPPPPARPPDQLALLLAKIVGKALLSPSEP